MKWGYYTPILRVTTNAYKRQQTLELQTPTNANKVDNYKPTTLLYWEALQTETNLKPFCNYKVTTNANKRQQTGLLHTTIRGYYKRQQTPTNRVTTHYCKKSLQTPTNANKQIVNFFIFWDSPILRPDLWATMVPLVTGHDDNLNASPIIKFRTHNRAEYTEKRGKCCPTNIKRKQLQTYYKCLQTKPTNTIRNLLQTYYKFEVGL